MLVFAIVVAAYTIAGGLEAVIWTDLLQGIALIGGGLICMPIIAAQVPGGFAEIIDVAWEQGKFDVGSTDLTLLKVTLWATILGKFMNFCQLLGTDQAAGQRYAAASSDREARKAVILGCLLTIPVWAYFFFVGTSLYVRYQLNPDPAIDGLRPDQIFPHFITTQLPAGIAGLAVLGLLAAAMSTLDSIINAAAATATTDFYQRLWVPDATPRHYLVVGRLFSLLFSIIMIGSALADPLFAAGQSDRGPAIDVAVDPGRRAARPVLARFSHASSGQSGRADRDCDHRRGRRGVVVAGQPSGSQHVPHHCGVRSEQVLGRSLCQRCLIWNWLWRQLPVRQP